MPSDCLSRLLLPTAIAAEVRRGAGAAAEDDGAEDDGAAWRAPIGVGGGDASGVDVISAVGLGTTFGFGLKYEAHWSASFEGTSTARGLAPDGLGISTIRGLEGDLERPRTIRCDSSPGLFVLGRWEGRVGGLGFFFELELAWLGATSLNIWPSRGSSRLGIASHCSPEGGVGRHCVCPDHMSPIAYSAPGGAGGCHFPHLLLHQFGFSVMMLTTT